VYGLCGVCMYVVCMCGLCMYVCVVYVCVVCVCDVCVCVCVHVCVGSDDCNFSHLCSVPGIIIEARF